MNDIRIFFSKVLLKVPSDFKQVFIFNIISKVLTALISVLIIRLLTMEAYSSYTIFFSISNLILGVLGNGIGLAYIRYSAEKVSEDKEFKDNIIFSAFILTTIIALILIIFSYIFHDQLNMQYSILIGSILVGWLFSFQQLIVSYFQAREKYTFSGYIINSKNIAIFVLLIVVSVGFRRTDISSIILVYLISGVIIAVGSLLYLLKQTKIDLKLGRKELFLFLNASGWLILYNFAIQSLGQIDIQMLKYLDGQSSVALYGVSSKYIAMMALLLPTLKTVLRVRMSKQEMVSSNENQKNFAKLWLKKSILPSAGITISAIIIAQFFFPLLNGLRYNDAILPFQIMSISMFFSYVFAPSSGLVMSMGKYRMQFIISVIAIIVKIGGNYLLIPKFGVIGASITYGLSYFIINCTFAIYVIFKTNNSENIA